MGEIVVTSKNYPTLTNHYFYYKSFPYGEYGPESSYDNVVKIINDPDGNLLYLYDNTLWVPLKRKWFDNKYYVDNNGPLYAKQRRKCGQCDGYDRVCPYCARFK